MTRASVDCDRIAVELTPFFVLPIQNGMITMLTLKQWVSNIRDKIVANNNLSYDTSKPLYAPGTQINFDANLVTQLKDDHKKLVRVFTAIIKNTQAGNSERVASLLHDFQLLFNAHAIAEYTKLYIFLNHAYKHDNVQHKIIMEFRSEMHQIGKAVRAFCAKWSNVDLSGSKKQELMKELDEVGKVLTHRISVEEQQLYEIYNKAPRALKNSTAHLAH